MPSQRIIFAALASAALLAAAPRMGDPAPPIHFDKVLPEQAPANAGFDKFAGKTVVLEFWATWCGPCVAAIPHLNELAAKFKDRPVVFLSVSDEEPEVVEYFLKKHPIDGLVGIAHAHPALQDYGLEGIPGTFLIDSHGKIAGILDPALLNASMIEAVMTYRELPAVDLSARPAPVLPVTAIVRPHIDEPNSEIFKPPFENFHGPFSSQKLNNRTLSWFGLRGIVQSIWAFNPNRIEGNALDDHNIYDVFLMNPNLTRETFAPWERSVVESAFHIQVTRVTREMDVWVLSKTDKKPDLLQPAGTIKDFSNNGRPGHIVVANAPVSILAQMVEGPAGKPVVDETGISGNYDFEFAWTGAGEVRSIEALRQGGFKIEAARRPIEYLLVKKID